MFGGRPAFGFAPFRRQRQRAAGIEIGGAQAARIALACAFVTGFSMVVSGIGAQSLIMATGALLAFRRDSPEV